MNKAKLNYWVDVAIAISFVASAISGLVFLLPGQPAATALDIGYRAWDVVHTWSSLAMIAGVLAHLVLHAKWIVCMTTKMFSSPASRDKAIPAPDLAREPAITRRAFLAMGGAATLGVVLSAAGYKAVFERQTVEASPSGSQTVETSPTAGAVEEIEGGPEAIEASQSAGQPMQDPQPIEQGELQAAPLETAPPAVAEERSGVVCPFGMVSDPYPGRCRRYVDSSGDGVCDLSAPGSGSN